MRRLWIGLCNVCRWAPIIWDDVDYDWEPLAKVMEYKLRRMALCFENGHHLHGHRDAKQCRVCAELLKRLREDNYIDNAGYNSPDDLSTYDIRKIVNHAHAMKSQDQSYLGKIFGKYLTNWWD